MTPHARTVGAVALALAAVTTAPYLVAAARPPAGAVFSGAFFYQDDFFQYLSFVEQAGRGRVVFANKFDPRPHAPAVVNVEWWAAGILARVLGDSPALGFHALRLLAIAAMTAGAARLLGAAGARGGRLAWGLALFATAGGLGWLRLLQGVPGSRVPDVLMGVYPFHQSLMNPHFVAATALVLWTLAFHLEWRAGRGTRWPWVATGWALGLSRPYDLVTFALCAFVLAFLRPRVRSPLRAALELAWLLPVFGYYAALMRAQRGLGGWTGVQSGDLTPPLLEFALAIVPALALAALGWRDRAAPGNDPLGVRTALSVWASVVSAIVVLYPSPMVKQFATTLGPALLLLAAAVAPPRLLPAAVLALFPTSAFLLWRVFHPYPGWFLPADYAAAVSVLDAECRDGQVAVAPSDLSLMIAGTTPCRVALGHRGLTPDWPEAVAAGTRFYEPATPAAWRLGWLDGLGADYVLLPAGGGPMLGGDPRYARLAVLPILELWRREGPR
jgi:hypothetical protein